MLRHVARLCYISTPIIRDVAEGTSGAAGVTPDGGNGDALTIQVAIRSMNRGDYPLRLEWSMSGDESPSADTQTTAGGTAAAPSIAATLQAASRPRYVTLPRSPYSVLRNRSESVGQCAMHLLPRRAVRLGAVKSTTKDSSSNNNCCGGGGGCACYCCCTALLYPLAPHPTQITTTNTATPTFSSSSTKEEGVTPAEDEDTMWVTDDFVLALHLASLTDCLRRGLQQHHHQDEDNNDSVAHLYAALQGRVQTQHVVVGALCADPLPVFQGVLASMSPLSVDVLGRRWCARTLLTAEEANHLKWLQEEAEEEEIDSKTSHTSSPRTAKQRNSHGSSSSRRDGSQAYSRATSLRALLVLSQLHATRDALPQESTHRVEDGTQSSHTSASPGLTLSSGPTLHEAQQVYERMQTRKTTEGTLCDFAALVILGVGRAEWRRVTLDWLMAKVHRHANCALHSEGGTSSDVVPPSLARLQCCATMTFTATLLWRYCVQATEAALVMASSRSTHRNDNNDEEESEVVTSSSAELGSRRSISEVATSEVPLVEWSALVKKLRGTCTALQKEASSHQEHPSEMSSSASLSGIHLAAVDTLLRKVDDKLHAFAARCEVTSQSAQLVEFVIWLLREMPRSANCQRHFHRLAERSSTEALMALEKSGVLRRATETLSVLVHELLPLLQLAATEDFYGTVMRDVIGQLETRLQRDPAGFTADDLACLAELGTHLFADMHPASNNNSASGVGNSGSSGESERAAATRELLAEVRVMDGGPWALCVSTYQQLKEMLVVLLRDHRTLKGQQKEQRQSEKRKDEARKQSADDDDEDAISDEVEAVTRYRPHIVVSESLRRRFLVFVEALVKAQLSQQAAQRSFFARLRPQHDMVANTPLFTFISDHVTLPNIQDEYRRKLFLLVNVGRGTRETPAAVGQRDGSEDNCLAGEDEIPEELRFLVNSLPLIFSPWASVMILREVLAESTGQNPRYTYVMNAAINLQLPVSATRSRIATTLNMWRFIRTQSSKLTLKESLMLRQRCIWNLPLAYILSSYWSLLTWMVIGCIVLLHIVGLDFESQIVASRLFQRFAPWAEWALRLEPWQYHAAAALAADYFDNRYNVNSSSTSGAVSGVVGPEDDLSNLMTGPLRSNEDTVAAPQSRPRRDHVVAATPQPHVVLTSYLLSGEDMRRRPMTVICVGSDDSATGGSSIARTLTERAAEEYGNVSALLQELAVRVPFPFFVDIPHMMPIEGVISHIAHRIRRISLESTWFFSRSLIRLFPIENSRPERALVSHTCTQANLLQRRITFLLYVHANAIVTAEWIRGLQHSQLAEQANLVVLVHEDSMSKGGLTADALAALTENNSSTTQNSNNNNSSSSSHTTLRSQLRMWSASKAEPASQSIEAAPRRAALRVLAFSRSLFLPPRPSVPHTAPLANPASTTNTPPPPRSSSSQQQTQQWSVWLLLWHWLSGLIFQGSHQPCATHNEVEEPLVRAAALEPQVTLSDFARRFGRSHSDYATYNPAIVQLVAGASGFTTDRLPPHVYAWYAQTRDALARA